MKTTKATKHNAKTLMKTKIVWDDYSDAEQGILKQSIDFLALGIIEDFKYRTSKMQWDFNVSKNFVFPPILYFLLHQEQIFKHFYEYLCLLSITQKTMKWDAEKVNQFVLSKAPPSQSLIDSIDVMNINEKDIAKVFCLNPNILLIKNDRYALPEWLLIVLTALLNGRDNNKTKDVCASKLRSIFIDNLDVAKDLKYEYELYQLGILESFTKLIKKIADDHGFKRIGIKSNDQKIAFVKNSLDLYKKYPFYHGFNLTDAEVSIKLESLLMEVLFSERLREWLYIQLCDFNCKKCNPSNPLMNVHKYLKPQPRPRKGQTTTFNSAKINLLSHVADHAVEELLNTKTEQS